MINRIGLIVGVALALLAGLAPRAQTPAVVAQDAWVRQPAAGRDVTAAYLVVENHGPAARAIVGASSDAAATLELHEMKIENGMMRMSPVDRIDVPAGGRAELKPGGFHIMIFGVKKPLEPGTTLPITLKLDDGSTLPVRATVRKAGAQ